MPCGQEARGRRRGARRAILLAFIALAIPAARAQVSAEQAAASQPLVERQKLIQDRLQRLEETMIKLSRALAESEPEKSERLRETLDEAGRRRVKARIAQLVELLKKQDLSAAEREQAAALADLESLLDTLSSTLNEAERRREERKRLEELKRQVRALLDEQIDAMQKTHEIAAEIDANRRRAGDKAGEKSEGAQPKPGEAAAPKSSEAASQALQEAEARQRELQRKAAELQKKMKSKKADSATPGVEQVGEAEKAMDEAAENLGDVRPREAEPQQQRAAEKLQESIDELEKALRQIRKEEMEETLATLESRLAALLDGEKKVRSAVGGLVERPAAEWTRDEQLAVAEAARTQGELADEAESIRRILVDEGTTVILPELIGQAAADIRNVAARLSRSEATAETRAILDDVIQLLEEVLESVKSRRDENERQESPEGQEGQPDENRPLLPGSAELKLLRSSQLRINNRTTAIASGPAAVDGALDPAQAARRQQELDALSERQRQLSELTRRMNERK